MKIVAVYTMLSFWFAAIPSRPLLLRCPYTSRSSYTSCLSHSCCCWLSSFLLFLFLLLLPQHGIFCLGQIRLRRGIVWIVREGRRVRFHGQAVLVGQKPTQAQPGVGFPVRGFQLNGRQGIPFGVAVPFQVTQGGGAIGIVHVQGWWCG